MSRPKTLVLALAALLLLPSAPRAADPEPFTGTWSARVGWGGESLNLRIRWESSSGRREYRQDLEILMDEIRGVTPDEFSSSGTDLNWTWKRDSGSFHFKGEGAWFLRPGGEFTFEPDAEYARNLESLGTFDVEARTLFWLALKEVDTSLVETLTRLDYQDVDIDDVVQLTRRGITSEYLEAVQGLGYRPSLEGVIRLRSRNVSEEILASFDELEIHGIPVEDFLRLHSRGVTADWMRGMLDAGYTPEMVEPLLRLHSRGVSVETVNGYLGEEAIDLSTEQILRLHGAGVPPEYLMRVLHAGIPGGGVEGVIRLHQRGAGVELIQGLVPLGYSGVEQILRIHSRGVPLDEIKGLHALGYSGLGVEGMIRLHTSGVGASFVKDLSDAGYSNLSVEELVRLKNSGDYEMMIRRGSE